VSETKCSESDLNVLLSSAGFMHPSELEKLVIKCANGLWCRYWYHWGQSNTPWIMAIQIRSHSGSPVGCDELIKYGFVRYDDCLYFINRANEDGTPYRE